jgi:anthranilate phosphoribosyltransferase
VSNASVDIVGSGGDNLKTINISTAAALLTAACGVPVMKHGNHAVTSQSGSADVLCALQIPVQQSSEAVKKAYEKYHFGFCYAPHYNPSLRMLKSIRCALNIPTMLNLLGPLLNPANPEYLLVGIYNKKFLERYAQTLQHLKIKKALVFHSAGSDELLSFAPAQGFLVTPDRIEKFTVNPESLGFRRGNLQDIVGQDAQYNAEKIIKVFEGEDNVLSDTIVFNCAVALYIYGKVNDLSDGVLLAKKTLLTGQALKLVKNLRKASDE